MALKWFSRCAMRTVGVLLLVLMPVSYAQSAQIIGEVSLVKGVVTAQSAIQAIRTLAKGSEVYLKDQIETAKDSFVVIKMADGGKLTLRPETQLLVQAYNQTAGQEEEKLKLIKGGLRALSGLIGRTRPASVKLETRTTTIGIRGTDYVVRDCVNCEVDEQALGDKPRIPPGPRGNAGGALPTVILFDEQTRRILDREEVGRIKKAVYFAVFDGGISAQSGNEQIDLDAVDACYRPGKTELDREFHCLLEIPRFLLHDKYLNLNRDEFTLYNAFSALDEEDEICQLDWE